MSHHDAPRMSEADAVERGVRRSVTFEDLGVTVYGVEGETVLDVANENGIDIEHACGGVCACSTCHVYVTAGGDSLPEPSEDEDDMLDNAPALALTSRLACQCVLGSSDVSVRIPTWNRNLAKEGADGVDYG